MSGSVPPKRPTALTSNQESSSESEFVSLTFFFIITLIWCANLQQKIKRNILVIIESKSCISNTVGESRDTVRRFNRRVNKIFFIVAE